jgi:ABC-2 type transport system permease protein
VTSLGLAGHQIRYEQRSFWRNPASALFTFMFPLMFFTVFGAMNRNGRISYLPGLNYNQFYLPGIIAFGVVGVCFNNLAIGLAFRRETGSLKRIKGTPLPAAVFLGGLIGSAIVVSLLITVVATVFGIVVYDVVFLDRYAALGLTLAVGVFTFSALGVVVASLLPNAESAPAITTAVFLPLSFISGIFIPLEPTSLLARVSKVFPIRHFGIAVFGAFDPFRGGWGFEWGHLVALAAWGVFGAAAAVHLFRWEPRRQ